MIDAGKMIKKFEFHEFKSRNLIVPAVELYCYVEDLPAFLALCVGPEEWGKKYGAKSDYEYNVRLLEKSKAQRPHFKMYIQQMHVTIYPKENLVVSGEAGLHYICQHLFDFLPSEIHSRFYPYLKEEDFIIGKLCIDHGSHRGRELDVKASDIHDGFMLTMPQTKEYSDTFSKWIASRRLKEQIKHE